MIAESAKNPELSAREDTIHMLNQLNDYELQAVRAVISAIIMRNDDYYRTQSESELFDRIDQSIAQIDEGMAIDSEIVEKEIMTEFRL